MTERSSELREPLPQRIPDNRDFLIDLKTLVNGDNPRRNVVIGSCALTAIILFSAADKLKDFFIK